MSKKLINILKFNIKKGKTYTANFDVHCYICMNTIYRKYRFVGSKDRQIICIKCNRL